MTCVMELGRTLIGQSDTQLNVAGGHLEIEYCRLSRGGFLLSTRANFAWATFGFPHQFLAHWSAVELGICDQ